MRFLKKKIARAQGDYLKSFQSSPSSIAKGGKDHSPVKSKGKNLQRRRRLPGYSFTSEKVKETKNIVLNYGRAISSFATSKLAPPYLDPLAAQEGVKPERFKKFVQGKK